MALSLKKFWSMESTVLIVLLTISSLEIFESSPIPRRGNDELCPKLKPADPVKLFHEETRKCYKENSKGPCPNNMVLQRIDAKSSLGECDCRQSQYLPYVYNVEKNECFPTFQQSYCQPGKWLVFDEQFKPVCYPNPCLNEMSDDEEQPTLFYMGDCVKYSGSSSKCPNTDTDRVEIPKESVVPQCVNEVSTTEVAEFSIVKVKQLACRPGTVRDITGRCVFTVETTEVDYDV